MYLAWGWRLRSLVFRIYVQAITFLSWNWKMDKISNCPRVSLMHLISDGSYSPTTTGPESSSNYSIKASVTDLPSEKVRFQFILVYMYICSFYIIQVWGTHKPPLIVLIVKCDYNCDYQKVKLADIWCTDDKVIPISDSAKRRRHKNCTLVKPSDLKII